MSIRDKGNERSKHDEVISQVQSVIRIKIMKKKNIIVLFLAVKNKN
jgi:hypothetical protein